MNTKTYNPKRTDKQYLEYDSLEGARDTKIEYWQNKLITIRKEQQCEGTYLGTNPHLLPKGTKMYYEKCKLDGEWGTVHICLECLDKMLDDYEY